MSFFSKETDPNIDFDHVDPTALMMLEHTRDIMQQPMKISSSYRTPEHSVAVGGLNNDAHEEIPCTAFDVVVLDHSYRVKLLISAVMAGWKRIGVNEKNGHIHLDNSDKLPSPAFWIE